MIVVDLPGQLAGVVQNPFRQDHAVREQSLKTSSGRSADKRLVPRRIKRTEEEEVVFESRYRTSQFAVNIVIGPVIQEAGLVDAKRIGLDIVHFGAFRSSIGADFSMVLVGTRLRYQLHHAAVSLTVLRAESRGLNVNFLDECEVDAAADRALAAGKHSQASESAVSDVYTVSYIEVFQPGSARDGRI